MKKIMMTLVAAAMATTMSAQLYVGGELGLSFGQTKVTEPGLVTATGKTKTTTVKILPEIGYNLNEKMAVGVAFGYDFNKNVTPLASYDVTSKTNEFVFKPYFRYYFVKWDKVGLFADAQFGMGFGKTQFALSLIAQFAKEKEHNVDGRPIGMLIFDYKGDDYSTDAFLKKVDGKCYSFNFPFNPLKLVATDKTKFMNLPAVTADRISDSFAKAYGLGQVQQSTIKQVIMPNTNKMQNPIRTSWFASAKHRQPQYDAKDKTYALFDKLRDYMIFTPDNSECVSLFEWLDGVKVIDLTPYPSDTKKVIVSLILDLFYEEMRQLGASKLDDPYRELRAMILVDEAHQFLNKDFNSFRNIISEGRMFGVGMILSTQNVSDFKTSKEDYSQFILSWVIHHVNSISKAEKFHGICKIGNEVKAIRTLPYYELIKEDKRFVTKYSQE